MIYFLGISCRRRDTNVYVKDTKLNNKVSDIEFRGRLPSRQYHNNTWETIDDTEWNQLHDVLNKLPDSIMASQVI